MSVDENLMNTLQKIIEDANNKQTHDIKKEIRREIDELKTEIIQESVKRKDLENKFEGLEQKNKKLEKNLRKNNIVVFGLDYQEEDNILSFVISSLNNYLGLDIVKQDVDDVFAIGKQKSNRPIIVKFVRYITKQEVFKNCKKLKNTNITISEELSLEERKQSKILRHHLQKARANKQEAYIKNFQLYVNNKSYTAEELTNKQDIDDEDTDEDSEKIKEKVWEERKTYTSENIQDTRKRTLTSPIEQPTRKTRKNSKK